MRSWWLGALALLLVVGMTWATVRAAPAAPADRVIVLYTWQVAGELEPCGCTTGPLGGFADRGPLLTQVRAEGSPTFTFDAGNLLVREELALDDLGGHARARAALLLDLVEAQGATAWAVGQMDVSSLGLDGLRAVTRGRSIKTLSVNLLDGAGRPAFEASTVVERGGRRIGVIGVTGAELTLPGVGQGYQVGDPVEGVRREVARLRPGVDLIVVLSNQDEQGNAALAAAVPDIDFVLGGPRDQRIDSGGGLYDADGAPPFLLPLESQGRYVGRLDVVFGGSAKGRPQPAPELRDSLRRERIAREELAYLEKLIVEEEGAPNPERLAAQGAALREEIQRALAVRTGPRPRPGFYYQALPVVPGPARDEAAAERIRAWKVDMERLSTQVARSSPSVVAFAGTASCQGCHPIQAAFQQGSRHARAYDTLKKLGRERDPACIGCHTTGWKETGGFFDPADVAGHEGVGCESCHGPLSDHPKGRRFLLETTAATCVRCHDVANSPGFDHTSMRRSVTCPSSGPPLPMAP